LGRLILIEYTQQCTEKLDIKLIFHHT